MTDYHPMWAELGLDLERHDVLLETLGGMYGDLILSQRNRPKSMDYFDFVVSEIHGLRVKELQDHRAGGGLARGMDSHAITLGVHEAIAARVAGMARRVGPKERVVFAGGGALNRCLRQLLSRKLGLELTVPQEPQIVGALGAALVACEE